MSHKEAKRSIKGLAFCFSKSSYIKNTTILALMPINRSYIDIEEITSTARLFIEATTLQCCLHEITNLPFAVKMILGLFF